MEHVTYTALAGLLAAPPNPSRKAMALAQEAVVQTLGRAIGAIGGDDIAALRDGVADLPEGLCLPGTARRVSAPDLASLIEAAAAGDRVQTLPVAVVLALGGARHLGGKPVLRALAIGRELALRAPNASAQMIAALSGLALLGGGAGVLGAAAQGGDAAQLVALFEGQPEAADGDLAVDLSDWGKVWRIDQANPAATERQLWDQFHHACADQLPREHIAPLFERLMSLDELDDIAKLLRLAEVSALHRRAPTKVVFAPAADQDSPETTWVP